MLSGADAGADAGTDAGADAGADAGEDSKSCDLSEPIRCAKLVSALASAPKNPLPHPLSCHVICLNQWESSYASALASAPENQQISNFWQQ